MHPTRTLCCLLALVLLGAGPGRSQSIDCSMEINGALRGEAGNIQDNVFHSLAIDPRDARVVYVGTETGGIFRTGDGGATWTRLRRGLKCGLQKTGYPQIFDIGIDPTDSRILYAATVNGPGPADNPLFPSATAGIYKSTDGGATWTQKIAGLSNTYTTHILVDATNPRRLYAGLGGVKSTFPLAPNVFYEGGIWTSTDAGETWSPLRLPPGVSSNILIDMVLRGADQRTLYASGQLHRDDAPVAYGLVRSTDGGQTWQIVNPPGETIWGFDAWQRDPAVLLGHDNSPRRRAYRSTDGGTSWTPLQAGFFGVIRIHPSDSRTAFYTSRTGIRKTTDGLETSRTTYEDPGLRETQQMLDIRIAPSNPSVVWAAATGYSLYRSVDGGESFQKITAVREMIYGSPVEQTLAAVSGDRSLIDGVALVNTGAQAARVTLTAQRNDGTLAAPAGPGRNPVMLTVDPGSQVSHLLPDLLGNTESGWLRISSDRPGVAGFSLAFDPGLNRMDGVNFSNRPLQDLVVPEVQDTEISLVNPGGAAAAAVARLYRDDGTEQAAAAIEVPAGGRLVVRPETLFPQPAADGYVRISSASGLVGQVRTGPESPHSLAAMSPLAGDSGARILWAPQYALGGAYRSVLTVVNLETAATNVSVTWRSSAGALLGRPFRFLLPPLGRRVIADPSVFESPMQPGGLDGYLSIGSDATLVTGSVRYGDAAGRQFEASLPLVPSGQRDLTFPHAAVNAVFFTGLAVLYPSFDPAAPAAQITVTVFNSRGAQVGQGRRLLQPNTRISELLTQLDPSLRPLEGGYFRLTSDRPVIGVALFGTSQLSLLAAIPGQVPPP